MHRYLAIAFSVALVFLSFSLFFMRNVKNTVNDYPDYDYNEPKWLKEYYDFPNKNSQYQKNISKADLKLLLEDVPEEEVSEEVSLDYIERYRTKILESLNIGHLLPKIDKQYIDVTVLSEREKTGYDEKYLLLRENNVGSFYLLMLLPKQEPGSENKKLPVIIGMHGHGDDPETFRDEFMGESFTKEGFAVVIPYFRAMQNPEDQIISTHLLLKGFTLMGIRVYETSLVMKYLKTVDYIDNEKIGIISHSGGSGAGLLLNIIRKDIDAFVYDLKDNYNSRWDSPDREEFQDIHCQTIPNLYPYYRDIYYLNTLKNNTLFTEYGFKREKERKEIMDFFKQKLS